ncbi:AraC family transcriptional regulator [Shimia sp. CNT1-13L.2]|uniref:AraC family transcriptional regulator n=1 Tax=Shimia sp. CNT1-13L.2 TaxID=2959663 RepID=UPI0020CD1EBE|nr:AraC family transcriptional regulator [Shimia sp. CNT1-13L.2]MCP9480774.1 AraC family transcriptional regulator [Shimia sp. CNT1-13L.2]
MSQSYEKRMLRVLQYIHDNPAGDMSLDRLADEAAMSRFHWHRVFRAMTGETCAQAVRRVRLHRAATMLLDSSTDPARIARDVGYDNARSFARAFQGHYGLSPSEFRKRGSFPAPLLTRRKGEFAMYPVTIREEGVRKAAGLLHKGNYSEIGKSFEAFGAVCQSRNLWAQCGPMLGVYFDNPDDKAEADLLSIAGATWHGEVPEDFESCEIPAGRYAVLTYTGPYAGIHGAYEALFGEWLPKSGEMPADTPCLEVYLNNPRDTAPDDLVTEICLALA